MIVFRCSCCSKVNISTEAHHCLHCGYKEAPVFTASENQTSGRNSTTNTLAHTSKEPSRLGSKNNLHKEKKLKHNKTTKSLKNSKLNVPSIELQNELFKCDLCDTVYTRPCHLSRHRKKHILEIKVDCNTAQQKVFQLSQQKEQEEKNIGKFETLADEKTFPQSSRFLSSEKSMFDSFRKSNVSAKQISGNQDKTDSGNLQNKRNHPAKNSRFQGKLKTQNESPLNSQCSSQAVPGNGCSKDDKVFNQTKRNRDETNSNNLSSKRNRTVINGSFHDDLKINEFPQHSSCSSQEVPGNGGSKTPNSNKVLIKRIKVPTFQKLFICIKCGKKFISESKLNTHFPMHFKDKRFECDRCNKKYFSEAHLKRHYRSHMDKELLKCDLCDLVYTRRCHLSRHRKKHISELTVNSCPDQQKRIESFYQREQDSSDDDNSLEHLEEKIFACTQCEVKFIRESDFNAHCLRHNEKNPFKCKMCAKEFRYELYLRRHCRTHLL